MYIKWIVCQVKPQTKEAFSVAQQKWNELQESKGLIGQVGGWNKKKQHEACIISFWEDKAAVDRFMANDHDRIFLKTRQAEYYEEISVVYYEAKMMMRGNEGNMLGALNRGQFLRIADCEVKPGKIEDFERMQKQVWIPGMQSAKGMLGGRFSQAELETSRYLVATFWEDEKDHREYVNAVLPDLRRKANAETTISQLEGKGLVLEESWKVIPLLNRRKDIKNEHE